MSEMHFVPKPNSRNLQAIKELLLSEIEWCERNRGISGKGKNFERGFLGGLGQAVYIVEQLIRISKGFPPEGNPKENNRE